MPSKEEIDRGINEYEAEKMREYDKLAKMIREEGLNIGGNAGIPDVLPDGSLANPDDNPGESDDDQPVKMSGFVESDHPRGQPKNSGQFAAKPNASRGVATKEHLVAKAEELRGDGEHVGFRFVTKPVNIGDELDNSYVWDGDQITDDELPGTAAFSSWKAIEEYAKHSKGIGGQVLLISGGDAGRGTDFADEIYIANAKVVGAISW